MSEKVLTGKTALKRILPVAIVILVIILVSVIFVSVKSSAPNPSISDKDSAYLTIGNYKISKERLYTYLRKNYGVSELAKLVDEKLLEEYVNSVTDADLKEYIIETLFSVEYDPEYDYSTDIKDYHEDPNEVWNDLKDSLLINGIISKDEYDDNNIELLNQKVKDYYRIDCAREKYAKDYYWSTLEAIGTESKNGLMFSDSEIENYYKENYGGTSTGIYIPFDSEEQALRVMKAFGINTNSTLLDEEDGWISSSYDPTLATSDTNEKKFLSPEEVVLKYIAMYNFMMKYHNNNTDILSNDVFTLKASEVSALTSAIDAMKIETKVSSTSFNLPSLCKTFDEDKNEAGNVEITWSVRNYDSADENTYVTISEDVNASGDYTATVTLPSSTKKVYLTATLKYGESETTKRYTLELKESTETQVINNTIEDIDLLYVIDEVAGLENYEATDFVNFHWSYSELKELDSTLANYLKYDSTKLSLTDDYFKFYKSYTIEPVKGTNYYFLAIKLAEKADIELIFEDDENYEDKTAEEIEASDALKLEIVEKLKEDLIKDNDITRILFENRTKNNLVIYDRYLEAVYEYSYNNFFDSTLKVTDYLPFAKTKKSDKTVVASFGFGKNKVEITADELYEALEAKYGVLTTLDFIDDYLLLSDENYNDVYNPYTNKVIDKEAYKEALTSEVATIKKNFEYGYFANASLAQYGFVPAFPADYGWKNFIEDYFVAFTDAELLTNRNFGGSIYTNAQSIFTKKLYESIDTVMEKINELYAEYYSVNVMNLVISVDYDLDATPDTNVVTGSETDYDPETNWTEEQKTLAKELAELFVNLAPQTNKATLTEQMSALVELYKKAVPVYGTQAEPTATDTIYTYNYFGKYKARGLKLKWEDSATYNNESQIVEEFSDKLKEIYQLIEEQDLVGETIDAPYFSEVAFETSYGFHMIAVTGTTEPVEIPENARTIIEKYLYINLTSKEKDELEEEFDKLASLTEDEKAFIDKWYTPATKELSGENPVALALVELRETYLNNINYENNDNLERYKNITEVLKKSYTEEEE